MYVSSVDVMWFCLFLGLSESKICVSMQSMHFCAFLRLSDCDKRTEQASAMNTSEHCVCACVCMCVCMYVCMRLGCDKRTE